MTERNVEILNAAGEAIMGFGGPWILAGDFNMTPGDPQQASEWLERIGGVVVAPELATCKSGCEAGLSTSAWWIGALRARCKRSGLIWASRRVPIQL